MAKPTRKFVNTSNKNTLSVCSVNARTGKAHVIVAMSRPAAKMAAGALVIAAIAGGVAYTS